MKFTTALFKKYNYTLTTNEPSTSKSKPKVRKNLQNLSVSEITLPNLHTYLFFIFTGHTYADFSVGTAPVPDPKNPLSTIFSEYSKEHKDFSLQLQYTKEGLQLYARENKGKKANTLITTLTFASHEFEIYSIFEGILGYVQDYCLTFNSEFTRGAYSEHLHSTFENPIFDLIVFLFYIASKTGWLEEIPVGLSRLFFAGRRLSISTFITFLRNSIEIDPKLLETLSNLHSFQGKSRQLQTTSSDSTEPSEAPSVNIPDVFARLHDTAGVETVSLLRLFAKNNKIFVPRDPVVKSRILPLDNQTIFDDKEAPRSEDD